MSAPSRGNCCTGSGPSGPSIGRLTGSFASPSWSLNRYEVTGAGSLQQASFDLKGAVSREDGRLTYDLEAKLGGLRAELLEPFNPQWAQKLKGPLPRRPPNWLSRGPACPGPRSSWTGTLDTAAFRGHGVSVEQLKISLAGNAREQNLKGQAQGNFGKLSLTATGPLFSSLKADLKLQAKNFQPARLGLDQAGETILNGKFTGAFSWPDRRTLAGLKVAGDLEARGRVGRGAPGGFAGQAHLAATQAGNPQGLPPAGTPGRRISPAPWTGPAQLAGSRAAWPPATARPYLPVATRGRLELAGALTGTFQAPHLSLQGSGTGLTLDGLSLKSFTFKANAAGWPPATGDLEVRGTGLSTPMAVFSQASLSCRGEANLWRLHFTAGAADGPQAEVSGTADLRSRPISLVLQKCSWRTPEFTITNTGPVQLRLLPGLQLATAAFKVNGGELALKLESQGTHLAGQINLRHLPIALFRLQGPPLKGKVDGQLSFAGEPGAPSIQGKVHWGPGQVGEFSFQSLQTTFDYRAGFLHLTGSLDEKAAGPRLVWDGQIPLHLSLIPLKWSLGDQNLALTREGREDQPGHAHCQPPSPGRRRRPGHHGPIAGQPPQPPGHRPTPLG